MGKILLLSNMYPSTEFPSYGIFVKNFTDNLDMNNLDYDKVVMYKSENSFIKLYRYVVFFIKTIIMLLFKKHEIIYVHYPSITGIPVLWVSKIKNMKIYTNIHGTDAQPVTEKEKKLEKNTEKIVEKSEKVIVPSNFFKNMILEKYKIKEQSIVVYPSGGVNSDVFKKLSNEEIIKFKNEILEDSDKQIIGFVSRIESTKGWKVFIKALEKLKEEKKLSNVKVVLIGSGKEEALLAKMIEEYELSDIIIRKKLVSQQELNQYFNIFDFFVFPTYKESLGLVAIESMATGTAVLASDIPPLNDYVIPDETGHLFEKGNAEQLAIAINRQLKLKDVEKKMFREKTLEMSQKYSRTQTNKIFRSIFNLKDK